MHPGVGNTPGTLYILGDVRGTQATLLKIDIDATGNAGRVYIGVNPNGGGGSFVVPGIVVVVVNRNPAYLPVAGAVSGSVIS